MSRALDMFHQMIRLNYKGSNNFSTNTGCLFTILVVAITLVQGINTFRSILGYHSPQVTVERTELIDSGLFTLNFSDFRLMLNVFGANYSSSFVSFHMNYVQAYKFDNGTLQQRLIQIPYKRCPTDYFKDYPVGTYPPEFIYTGICPDVTEIELNGADYNSPNYKSIAITVTKCMNGSHPEITCKSSEEIDEYLKNFSVIVGLFYSNSLLASTNYSTPITYFMDYVYWYLPPAGFTLEADVPVNQQDLITDDNLFLEGWNPKTQTTYQFDPTEMKDRIGNLQKDPIGNDILLNILMHRSSKQYTTKRLYPKLQQGLANVGSVFSLCVGVFGILTAMYVSRVYPLSIANQLYEFDLPNPQKETTKHHSKKKKEKSKGNKAESDRETSKPQETKKEGDTELESILLGGKDKLRYNFIDFILGFFPCIKREKNLIINKAITAAEKEIDLVEILKKLQQLDRLKNILLDEDELIMISYYQPPVISLNNASEEQDLQATISRFNNPKGKSSKTSKKKTKSTKEQKKSNDSSKNSHNSNQNDDGNAFAVVALRSYNRLLKKRRNSPVSRKILKYMHPKVNDALFDFVINDNLPNQSQLTRNVNKPRQMSKLEAGLIISGRVQRYLERRRARTKQSSKDPANDSLISPGLDQVSHDVLGDCSFLSEKQPLKPVTQQLDITHKFDQESRTPSIALRLNEMSSLRMNTSNSQTIHQHNSQSDPKLSRPSPSKQEHSRRLPPLITFPKTASNPYFDAPGSSLGSKFLQEEKESPQSIENRYSPTLH